MNAFFADLRSCLLFWSRYPLPAGGPPPPFSQAIRTLPIASLLIAAPAILALGCSAAIGLPPFASSLLALGALAIVTGALHEDGLADCADSFGGHTPERRLAIMKDSQIGAFGALTLVFSIGLRASALTALLDASTPLACACLLSASVFSRFACLTPLALLPPARASGAGALAGAPLRSALALAGAGAVGLGFTPLLCGANSIHVFSALAFGFAAAYALVPFARNKLGGQTGDVAGAAQQLSEITILLALSCR